MSHGIWEKCRVENSLLSPHGQRPTSKIMRRNKRTHHGKRPLCNIQLLQGGLCPRSVGAGEGQGSRIE